MFWSSVSRLRVISCALFFKQVMLNLRFVAGGDGAHGEHMLVCWDGWVVGGGVGEQSQEQTVKRNQWSKMKQHVCVCLRACVHVHVCVVVCVCVCACVSFRGLWMHAARVACVEDVGLLWEYGQGSSAGAELFRALLQICNSARPLPVACQSMCHTMLAG